MRTSAGVCRYLVGAVSLRKRSISGSTRCPGVFLWWNVQRFRSKLVLMAKQARVFVVDDDRVLADTISAVLRSVGFQVRTFYDGLPAINYAIGAKPDVIVTDYRMPTNGLRLASWLKDYCPACKVVLISGDAPGCNLDQARSRISLHSAGKAGRSRDADRSGRQGRRQTSGLERPPPTMAKTAVAEGGEAKRPRGLSLPGPLWAFS